VSIAAIGSNRNNLAIRDRKDRLASITSTNSVPVFAEMLTSQMRRRGADIINEVLGDIPSSAGPSAVLIRVTHRIVKRTWAGSSTS
jgi:hypothetical protein